MEKYKPKSMLSMLYDAAKKYAGKCVAIVTLAGCANNAALNQEEMSAYQNSGKPDIRERIDKMADAIADMPQSNYKQPYEAWHFIRSNADVNQDGQVTEKELSDFLKKNPWIPYKGE